MLRQIPLLAVQVLLEARRSRFMAMLALSLPAGWGVAEFSGALAVTEADAMQIALLAALLRLIAAYLLALFVVTAQARELADRGTYLLLALPLRRADYFAGKLLGAAALALLCAVLHSLLLLLYAPAPAVLWWGLSLWCELVLVAAFSLVCVLGLQQPVAALTAVAGFYILARSIRALETLGHNLLSSSSAFSDQTLYFLIRLTSLALPDLHGFAATEWLLYQTGEAAALLPVIGQTALYLALLVGVGLFDLYRKNL
jgi:ABC-type transport system involved in multi-copper enzyme maturation permease subunit